MTKAQHDILLGWLNTIENSLRGELLLDPDETTASMLYHGVELISQVIEHFNPRRPREGD